MLGNFGNLSLTVGNPWWLLAIPLVLPPLVWLSHRSLAGLGRSRRALAILARGLVLSLVVFALAEPQIVRTRDDLTTIFVLDRSQSIPQQWQGQMLQYINAANRQLKKPDDLAGVVVFGADARVEVPPTRYPGPMVSIENSVNGENSNLAGAIKLALASFPEDTARRLVIVSDGNENRGDALEQAIVAKSLGVQIDAVPIEYFYDSEVLVEKVSVPPDVKQGETVNINVVVRASQPTAGGLQIFQQTESGRVPIGDPEPTRVDLQRGVNVLTLKKTIDQADFYRFSAEFIPDADSGDRRANNNVAYGFTHARGKANVLLIEGTAGEHAELVQALREREIEVTVLTASKIDEAGVIPGDPLPTDLAALQAYDSIILANVPKDSIEEPLQALLERNVHDFGAGLVMLGGPNSFGAGGWMNTPIEKALPVDMQIKATRVMGKSALAMIMHASEIPEGNYWQKKVAQEALSTLSSYDYAGLIHWQGQEAWLFPVRPIGSNKGTMLRMIDSMTPGDMPDFDPSLQLATNGLRAATDAMTKHLIVISDGDPTPPTNAVIRQLVANKITVTAVLVAAHGGDTGGMFTMQNLANKTKGRFYNVTNPKALPRIYQKEARLISRPLIYERAQPWAPQLVTFSEPILGLSAELPGITGLVQTTVKENVLVEVPLVSPLPTGTGQLTPLLAHWTYGLGRAVAFTSDAGRRWTGQWADWDRYGAFWSQVIRWSMRPVDSGNLTLSLRREDGQVKIVVDALDKDDQFLNFLDFRGFVNRPDATPGPDNPAGRRTDAVSLAQIAPGRYEGTIDQADERGNYFVTLAYNTPEGGTGLIRSGVSIPYSDEYREIRSNPATLATIVDLTGGRVIEPRYQEDRFDLEGTLRQADVFRRDQNLPPPRSFDDLWPDLLWLAAVLFLVDVAVRRVAPDVDRLKSNLARSWERWRGREVAAPVEYMEKLKGRKAEVAEQLDRSRQATRFQAPVESATSPRPLDEPLLGGEAPAKPERPSRTEAARPGMAPVTKPGAPESYADRLLKAKRKVWEEQPRKDEGGN